MCAYGNNIETVLDNYNSVEVVVVWLLMQISGGHVAVKLNPNKSSILLHYTAVSVIQNITN